MSRRPHICFTFVGDVTRDSRLRRFASAAADVADVYVLQLRAESDDRSLLPNEENASSMAASIPAPGATAPATFRVIPFPMRGSLRSALPRFWRQAASAIRDIGGDICIASDLYSLPAAARAARSLDRPLLYDARELYASVAALQGRALMQRFWTWVERRYTRRAAAVFTVNESIAAILRQRCPDVRVVRNVPDWRSPGASQQLRTSIGIPDGRRILLSQGGLQRGRGALPLVDALSKLPDCHLVFLGDGVLRGEIETAARFSGVSDRVTVLPAVPSAALPQWTASADLGMCLIENLGQSYYLSLPNKLFEYIAAGVPIVGSDFPEIGSLLRETGVGISVDPSDRDLVVRAVRTLLDDADRYARAKDACRIAAEGYRWEKERGVLMEVISASLPRA